jgi:uncharacterized membrane protein
MNLLWTRARVGLVALAALSASSMLYVGVFQIGWIGRLACPAFGSGCESVALSPFAWPLGLADGLLGAAFCGILCALALIPRRNAARAVVALATVWLALNLLGLADMARLGAFCFWCTLAAALSPPMLVLAVFSARQPLAIPPGETVAPGQGS